MGAVNIGTSQPVTRFPMGIPPRNAELYTLMTRPRISLGVINCTRELTLANTVIRPIPVRNKTTQLRATDCESAKSAIPTPSQTSEPSAIRPLCGTLPIQATPNEPTTAPTPDEHMNKVKVQGPPWKTVRANHGRNVIIGDRKSV